MRVTCTITTGTDDDGDQVESCVEDDTAYTPETATDLLRRCGESVVWMFNQTHADAKP